MILKILLFLALNFAALGIGVFFTAKGVPSDWYLALNKAPWTPPGWVFGAAWTTIMLCFSFYMPFAVENAQSKNLLIALFALQWILNVAWTPVFFKFHAVVFGLVIIVLLTIVLVFIFFYWLPQIKWVSLLLVPYIIWLLIASSLNAFVWLKN